MSDRIRVGANDGGRAGPLRPPVSDGVRLRDREAKLGSSQTPFALVSPFLALLPVSLQAFRANLEMRPRAKPPCRFRQKASIPVSLSLPLSPLYATTTTTTTTMMRMGDGSAPIKAPLFPLGSVSSSSDLRHGSDALHRHLGRPGAVGLRPGQLSRLRRPALGQLQVRRWRTPLFALVLWFLHVFSFAVADPIETCLVLSKLNKRDDRDAYLKNLPVASGHIKYLLASFGENLGRVADFVEFEADVLPADVSYGGQWRLFLQGSHYEGFRKSKNRLL